jgi:hypothetical protein
LVYCAGWANVKYLNLQLAPPLFNFFYQPSFLCQG